MANTPKKPTFVVKESKFVSRVKRRWRFPRGKHSKVRQMHRGRPALPQVGYGSSKSVRGFVGGMKSVLISNVKEMEKINSEKEGIIISSNVSNKKKLDLLNLAIKNDIKVLNVKEPKVLIEKINKGLEERKKTRKLREENKTKKQKEKEKQAEEKKKKESEEKESSGKKEEEKKKKESIEKTITKKQ